MTTPKTPPARDRKGKPDARRWSCSQCPVADDAPDTAEALRRLHLHASAYHPAPVGAE